MRIVIALLQTLTDVARSSTADAATVARAYWRELVDPPAPPTADTPALATCLRAPARAGADVVEVQYLYSRWPLVGELVIDPGMPNAERVGYRRSHRDLLRETGLPKLILSRPLRHDHAVGAELEEARDYDCSLGVA